MDADVEHAAEDLEGLDNIGRLALIPKQQWELLEETSIDESVGEDDRAMTHFISTILVYHITLFSIMVANHKFHAATPDLTLLLMGGNQKDMNGGLEKLLDGEFKNSTSHVLGEVTIVT